MFTTRTRAWARTGQLFTRRHLQSGTSPISPHCLRQLLSSSAVCSLVSPISNSSKAGKGVSNLCADVMRMRCVTRSQRSKDSARLPWAAVALHAPHT